MEKMVLISINEAIRILEEHKKMYGDDVIVCMVNLDNGDSIRERKSVYESNGIIKSSRTVAFNADNFIPHILAFSEKTPDRKVKQKKIALPRNGIVHDFLIGNGVCE